MSVTAKYVTISASDVAFDSTSFLATAAGATFPLKAVGAGESNVKNDLSTVAGLTSGQTYTVDIKTSLGQIGPGDKQVTYSSSSTDTAKFKIGGTVTAPTLTYVA